MRQVFFSKCRYPFLLRSAQHFFYSSRNTGHQRTGRYLHSLRHHAPGGNQRPLSDNRTIKNNSTDANQTTVLDLRSVDHRTMPHSHVITNDHRMFPAGDMNDAAVLNITSMTDTDEMYVTPYHRLVPDAGVMSQRHIAGDHRAGCHVNAITTARPGLRKKDVGFQIGGPAQSRWPSVLLVVQQAGDVSLVRRSPEQHHLSNCMLPGMGEGRRDGQSENAYR